MSQDPFPQFQSWAMDVILLNSLDQRALIEWLVRGRKLLLDLQVDHVRSVLSDLHKSIEMDAALTEEHRTAMRSVLNNFSRIIGEALESEV